MNRLTKRDLNGEVYVQLYGDPEDLSAAIEETYRKQKVVLERLAAYEDTGLTPEEITDGKMLTGLIPCSERLPREEYQTVLCVDNEGYYFVGVYNKEFGFRTQDIGTDGNAVAWMPLPEPWEGDK